MSDLKKNLLALLHDPAYKPMKQHEIARALNLPSADRSVLRNLLRRMRDRGELICLRKNRWIPADETDTVTGAIRVNPKGFGMVCPAEDGQGGDIYIPAAAVGDAMDGDTVMVRLDNRPLPRHAPHMKREGAVVRVIERGRKEIAGLLKQGPYYAYVIPDNPSLLQDIRVASFAENIEKTADDGHKVVIRLEPPSPSEKSKREPVRGVVVEDLGHADDPGVDMLSILRAHGIQPEFPRHVLNAAKKTSSTLDPKALEGRVDCRNQCALTIDPENAKDYDDAVYAERDGDGWRLCVHIADVAQFVPMGSAVDREASLRGNSVYLVDRAVSMLPPDVTLNVCSLLPDADKLTHTADLRIDKDGGLQSAQTYLSVIRSRACLSYDDVQHFFDGRNALPSVSEEVRRQLRDIRAVAGCLRERRLRDGSLDFNVPEVICRLDDRGRPIDIHRRASREAYRVIEDCMLAANRAVASFIFEKGYPALYRIHEEPDEEQWAEMNAQTQTLGLDHPLASRADMNRLARKVEGTPVEYAAFIAMLRNLKRAVYSAERFEHFGLGFASYTHFTSPIRRYPDLVVHRILRAAEEKKKHPYSREDVHAIAQHCTRTEWEADAAESESLDVKRLEYYRDKMWNGDTGPFRGVVTSIVSRGLIVELTDSLLRGMVAFSALSDDHYTLDASGAFAEGRRRGRRIGLGEALEVELTNVDMARRMVDFRLAEKQPKKSLRGKPPRKKGHTAKKRGKRKKRKR